MINSIRSRRKQIFFSTTSSNDDTIPKKGRLYGGLNVPKATVWCLAVTIVAYWGVTNNMKDVKVTNMANIDPISLSSSSSSNSVPCSSSIKEVVSSDDETCKSLPLIRPTCTKYDDFDKGIEKGSSPEGINPTFSVGSYYADKVVYHMKADRDNFVLIKEYLDNKNKGLALDFGANQGFYTYYLATLGLDVHAFEIDDKNFKSLQHGVRYNPKDVSDRVNLYRVGIGDVNGRFAMRGNNYEGFLVPNKEGSITLLNIICCN